MALFNIRGARRAMSRLRAKGFTFVELMVAIAVLIVIAALIMPSLDSATEDSKFRSACDQISSAASVCRAEARRTGKPVAVVATMNEDGRQTIVSVPLGDVAQFEEDTTIEVESRVLMVMPHGVSIHAQAGAPEEDPEAEVSVAVDPQDADTTQSLIIYWGNGEATPGSSFVVKSSGGRTAAARVNSWTGDVSIAETPDTTAAAAAEPLDDPTDVADTTDTEDSLSVDPSRDLQMDFSIDP